MIRLLLVILFIFSGLRLKAQTPLDSIYSIWENHDNTAEKRTQALTTYISQIKRQHPDSAFSLASDLISFAKENNDSITEMNANRIKSLCMRFKGEPLKGLIYSKKAMAIATNLGDLASQGKIYQVIGILYSEVDNYPQAIKHFEKSLVIQNEIGSKKGQAFNYNGIGLIYLKQGNYKKASEYVTKAVELAQSINDSSIVAHFSPTLGHIYNRLGEHNKALKVYHKCLSIRKSEGANIWVVVNMLSIAETHTTLGEYDLAQKYASDALLVAQVNDDKSGKANCYRVLSDLNVSQGRLETGLKYAKLSYQESQAYGNLAGKSSKLLLIGNLHYKLQNFPSSIDACNKAYTIASEAKNISLQKHCCDCLYKSFKASGDNKKALFYFKKSTRLINSMREIETAEKLQQMEYKNQNFQDSIEASEIALKIELAHQKEVANKNKTRNLLLGSAIILILIAIGMYGRVRFIRKSKETLQTEKDRSENLLLNILPAEIAEELKEKGKAEARAFEQISILFTDFKGFTQLSEQLSATELVAEINHCFEAFDKICETYQVEKIKTIGDSYMAAGGLPVKTTMSTKNTVLAAIEMAEFVSNRKNQRLTSGQLPFEMRAGIHTGHIVAGIVGIKKFQYDVWGDTVNIASRMESHGEPGKVNVSETVYKLLQDDDEFVFESRGKVPVKGKGEIEMYFVSKKL